MARKWEYRNNKRQQAWSHSSADLFDYSEPYCSLGRTGRRFLLSQRATNFGALSDFLLSESLTCYE